MRWFLTVCLVLGGTLGLRPPQCEAVNSRLYDGVDDEINFGTDTAVNNLTAYTVAAWMKPAGAGEGNVGKIADKRNNSAGWAFSVCHTGSAPCATRVLRLFTDRSSVDGAWTSAAQSWTADSWQHVAVSYNSASTANDPVFYVNGTVSATSEDSTPSGTLVADASTNLVVGNQDDTTRTFSGNLAYVHIYNRILSESEIDQILVQPESVTSGLVFYATLQGNDPETDDSSTALSGTVTGTTIDTGDGPSVQVAATCLSQDWTQPRTWLRLASGRMR